MFHDNMVFILHSKEEAVALGQMLSAEGIRWADGTDPAEDTPFPSNFALWFLKSLNASHGLCLAYMDTLYYTREDCLNYASSEGYEPPIEFRTWAPSASPCKINSIDELL